MASNSTTKTTAVKAKATSAGRRKSTAKKASRAPRAASKTAATTPETAKVSKRATKAAPPPAADAEAKTDIASSAPTATLRRPDLIQAVADRVSLKRGEAKMVFDVVLDEIGKALDATDEVVVPPLGKLMVKKRVEKPGGAMVTLKLKRAAADPSAGDTAPLAKGGEQG